MKIQLNHILEGGCLLLALIRYRHLQHTLFYWCIPFLFFVLLGELGASYFKYRLNKPNGHIYILISIGNLLFYNYLFYHLHKGERARQAIRVSTVLLVIAFLGLFFFFSDYQDYDWQLIIVSGLYLTVVASSLLLRLSLFSEDTLPVLQQPGFWLAAGVLLFFSGISIPFMLHAYLHAHRLDVFGLQLYNLAPQVLCIILYGCLFVSIVLCRKEKQISW